VAVMSMLRAVVAVGSGGLRAGICVGGCVGSCAGIILVFVQTVASFFVFFVFVVLVIIVYCLLVHVVC
jgi:hypothetical protein